MREHIGITCLGGACVVAVCCNVYFGNQAIADNKAFNQLCERLSYLQQVNSPSLTPASLENSEHYLAKLEEEIKARESAYQDYQTQFFNKTSYDPIEFSFFLKEKLSAFEKTAQDNHIHLHTNIISQLGKEGNEKDTINFRKQQYVALFLVDSLLRCNGLEEILSATQEGNFIANEAPISMAEEHKLACFVTIEFLSHTKTFREFCNIISKGLPLFIKEIAVYPPHGDKLPAYTHFKVTVEAMLF